MDTRTYTENIKERLAVNFMISDIAGSNMIKSNSNECDACSKSDPGVNVDSEDMKLSLIADYHNIWDRTPFDISQMTDKYQIHETCYIKEMVTPSLDEIKDFFEGLTVKARHIELPENHFYTDITGVLVGAAMPDGTERLTGTLNYDKVFRFLKQGFVSVRLVCVDLKNEKVYTNKAGRKLRHFYGFGNK